MSLYEEYLSCCGCGDEIIGAYSEDGHGNCFCSDDCMKQMEESFDDEQ